MQEVEQRTEQLPRHEEKQSKNFVSFVSSWLINQSIFTVLIEYIASFEILVISCPT